MSSSNDTLMVETKPFRLSDQIKLIALCLTRDIQITYANCKALIIICVCACSAFSDLCVYCLLPSGNATLKQRTLTS